MLDLAKPHLRRAGGLGDDVAQPYVSRLVLISTVPDRTDGGTTRLVRRLPTKQTTALGEHHGKRGGHDRKHVGVAEQGGYLLKHSAVSDLESAIATVLVGGEYLSSSLALALGSKHVTSPHSMLTDRQIQVLKLIAGGATSRQIGEHLGISAKTVDVHRARIQERLGVRDIAGLTRYAMKHHLVS